MDDDWLELLTQDLGVAWLSAWALEGLSDSRLCLLLGDGRFQVLEAGAGRSGEASCHPGHPQNPPESFQAPELMMRCRGP